MERRGRSPEERLAQAWAALRGGTQALRTQEGEGLGVVFPGVRNHGPGPDFRRAILATERGRLVRGDVEVHGAASGWKRHGHEADPRYQGVVLHVVGHDDLGRPTALASGARAPVLVLRPQAKGLLGADAPLCSPCSLNAGLAVEQTLAAQGWLRFQVRVRTWLRRLNRAEGDQALYEALMEGLGYAQNRAPFLRLARALPWKELLEHALGHPPQERQAIYQGLLLGAAGFLEEVSLLFPLLSQHSWEELRRRWGSWGQARALGPSDWQRWGCRPAALPWVRLAGAGVLLARWGSQGPAAQLLDAERLPTSGRALGPLRQLYTVSGAEAGLGFPFAPIGRGRADVLVVNVALPFLGAWGSVTDHEALEREVAKAYVAYPGLEPDGVVRRLIQGLRLPSARLKACHQQGLHHIFRRYCIRGRQERCPLAAPVAGSS